MAENRELSISSQVNTNEHVPVQTRVSRGTEREDPQQEDEETNLAATLGLERPLRPLGPVTAKGG